MSDSETVRCSCLLRSGVIKKYLTKHNIGTPDRAENDQQFAGENLIHIFSTIMSAKEIQEKEYFTITELRWVTHAQFVGRINVVVKFRVRGIV